MGVTGQWTDGYVAEIDYTHGFYREMVPASLGLALTLSGFDSPDLESSFKYCELGFGQGVTLNLLAAAHPRAEFWGTDFNPAHTAGARALAQAAGSANVHLFEDSFAEFLERDTPSFDYVCLHGVYSWISPENQKRIVEFARRKLRPGGVLYISYNCLPGWGAGVSLRHLLATHVQSTSGSMVNRLAAALPFAQRLVDTKAMFFAANAGVVKFLEEIKNRPPNYLIHEYLNQDFHPMYFSEVATQLAEAKLTFAGSATLSDHVDIINFTEAGMEILVTITDPLLHQTVRDYLVNKQFRRDVFVKGARALTAVERTERLRSQRFALKLLRKDVPLKARCVRGEFGLQPEVGGPVLDRLAEGPTTLDELLQVPAVAALGVARVLQVLTVLVGTSSLEPALPEAVAKESVESTRRMNEAIIKSSERAEETTHLVSPVLGSAVGASRIDQLFLKAHLAGEDLPTSAWKLLTSRGHRLMRDGKPIESEEESLTVFRELAGTFKQKTLEIWKQLGVVRD